MTAADLATLASDLRAEARRADQRRLLVCHGERDACLDAAFSALSAAEVSDEGVTLLSTREGFRFERHRPKHARRLLGRTREAVVFDAFGEFSPNALGQSVGAVDGGGLYLLLVPPLDSWPDRPSDFEESLAVPPYALEEVGHRFRERLVETLRTHPGVAVYDADAGTVERDGLTGASSASTGASPTVPTDPVFPERAYEACLTRDQSRALGALERLREPGEAVVLEADRGRGKSAAAGLAAAALAAADRDVLVTAPARSGAGELFTRARALLSTLGVDLARDEEGHLALAEGPGRVRFRPPREARTAAGDADVVIVDEAAALPVEALADLLAAPAVAFVTTVHGYEGAGRGFSVRFRDRLADSPFDVTTVRMDDPIRYARGDPVEGWAFRALLLDARPAVAEAVTEATPESATYRRLDPEELRADEHLLSEAFGLLVFAHYRTEPDDLARLLDAPNLSVRALTHEGHVVSVALVAREGGLSASTRRAMYDGERVRGNMVPDVLTSQVRDPDAAAPVGARVMRIATHDAVRRTGFGSRLLSELRAELADGGDDAGTEPEVDYCSTAFGATPGLVSFWRTNGYRTVHLATTRNETSGEHSVVMLDPLTDTGETLARRHARLFRERVGATLTDALADASPDVVRAALGACGATGRPPLELSDYEWRVVVGAAFGPGLADVAPRPFRRLALAHLLDSGAETQARSEADPDRASENHDGGADLSPREERLLVVKALQARDWESVTGDLGYVSPAECMRAFGAACRSLVDAYGELGGEVVREERERYRE